MFSYPSSLREPRVKLGEHGEASDEGGLCAGHEIADTDVIAIARLRGSQLKELMVPADCVSESSGGPYYSELRPSDVRLLEAEVSSSLLRTWTLSTLRSPAQSETGQTRSYLRTLQQLQSYGGSA